MTLEEQRLLAYSTALSQGYKEAAVIGDFAEKVSEWIASKEQSSLACDALRMALKSPSVGKNPADLLTVAETLYTFAVKKPVPKTPPAPEPRMIKLGSRRAKGA